MCGACNPVCLVRAHLVFVTKYNCKARVAFIALNEESGKPRSIINF